MNILAQVTAILAQLFINTAKKNKIAVKDVALVFKLKSSTEFICRYDDLEIKMSEAGIKAAMFSSKINSFVTSALITHAVQNGIDKSQVNVLMKVRLEAENISDNQFNLFLRNGTTIIKELTIDNFLKLQ